MNQDAENQVNDEEFTSKLEGLLSSASGGDGILSNTPSAIRTAAFHDFSEYRYLMTPLRGLGPVGPDSDPYPDPIVTADTLPIGLYKSAIQDKDQFISSFETLMLEMATNEVPGQVTIGTDCEQPDGGGGTSMLLN